MAWRQPQRFAWDTCGSFWLSARRETASVANTAEQPDRLAQLKNPKTIHFLNGFSSAMAPALRGAPGTSEKTEIGAIAPPHARPPVQRRRPEAPARRRNRRTWENVAPRAFLGTSPKTPSRARFFFSVTLEAISLKTSGTLVQVVILPQ